MQTISYQDGQDLKMHRMIVNDYIDYLYAEHPENP